MQIPIENVIKNLNEPAWLILALIAERPAITLKEIRQETSYSQEKAYKVLSLLEGGVLIASERQEDARSIGYVLTKYGQYALESKNSLS